VRVVFDKNVLARAHQNAQGPARRALLHVTSEPHVLIISPYILAELERVLTYPRLLKKSGLTANDIAEYLERLALVSSLVAPATVPANLVRDSTDSPILGTALAGKANVLCTRDEDFFEKNVREFCEANGVRLLTDLQLLDALRLQ
jgi:putative PIN family toxin of toxin-antitoxin system